MSYNENYYTNLTNRIKLSNYLNYLKNKYPNATQNIDKLLEKLKDGTSLDILNIIKISNIECNYNYDNYTSEKDYSTDDCFKQLLNNYLKNINYDMSKREGGKRKRKCKKTKQKPKKSRKFRKTKRYFKK